MLNLFMVNYSSLKKFDGYESVLSKILDRYETFRLSMIRGSVAKGKYLVYRYILKKIISIYTRQKIYNVDIKYNFFGKPYIQNKHFHFNLSHSGDCLLIGVSDKLLGVDVENVKPVNLNAAKLFCTEKELSYIHNGNNSYNRFFTLWTLKEAYTKNIGEGLHYNLKDIDISFKDSKDIQFKVKQCLLKSLAFFTKEIKNYIMSICCDPKYIQPKMIKLHEIRELNW